MTAAVPSSRPTPPIRAFAPRTFAAGAVLALVTVWLSWQAWKLEKHLSGESETSDLVDKPAPDLTATTLDGRNVALADFRDKQNVVVAFWASWCVPCRIEMPLLKRFYKTARKTHTDFEILAVSIDDETAPAAQYADTEKLPFPVMVDKSQRIANVWHVGSIPSLFVVDKAGKVTYFHLGADTTLEFLLAGWLDVKDYKPEIQTPNARGN